MYHTSHITDARLPSGITHRTTSRITLMHHTLVMLSSISRNIPQSRTSCESIRHPLMCTLLLPMHFSPAALYCCPLPQSQVNEPNVLIQAMDDGQTDDLHSSTSEAIKQHNFNLREKERQNHRKIAKLHSLEGEQTKESLNPDISESRTATGSRMVSSLLCTAGNNEKQ